MAAERARARAEREAPSYGVHGLKRPAAAFWSLVTLRR
jgi:hypothetical protein